MVNRNTANSGIELTVPEFPRIQNRLTSCEFSDEARHVSFCCSGKEGWGRFLAVVFLSAFVQAGVSKAQSDAVAVTSDVVYGHKDGMAMTFDVFRPKEKANGVGNPLREQFPALKFEPSRADAFSPLMQVTADDAPTLLFHGDKDELVPLWHSEKIQKAFEDAKVENKLVVIQGAAHGFNDEGNRRLAKEMTEWFDRYLVPRSR